MVVPNEQLKRLTIEKKLNLNGSVDYLKKGGDPGFEEQQKQIEDHKKVKKSEGIF